VTTLTIAPRATDLAADPSLTTTVHIASSGVAGVGANAISTVTAQAGSTIKVTGSNDLAIAALTNRATVDASSFAGKLAIAGSAGADTIILGSGQDTVTVGAAGSTFAHIDTIAGFTSADTLILAGAPVAAAADLVKQDVSAAGSLEQALASVEAVTAANGVSYFNYAGNTYVLANTGAGSVTAPGSDDLVVRIVGVQVLTADASGIHGKIAA
jgi:S-layer protein